MTSTVTSTVRLLYVYCTSTVISSQNSTILLFAIAQVSFTPPSWRIDFEVGSDCVGNVVKPRRRKMRSRGMRAQMLATQLLVSCARAISFASIVCGIASVYSPHTSKPLQRTLSKSASVGRLSVARFPCTFVYLPYTSRRSLRTLSNSASLARLLVSSFSYGLTFVFLLGSRKALQRKL